MTYFIKDSEGFVDTRLWWASEAGAQRQAECWALLDKATGESDGIYTVTHMARVNMDLGLLFLDAYEHDVSFKTVFEAFQANLGRTTAGFEFGTPSWEHGQVRVDITADYDDLMRFIDSYTDNDEVAQAILGAIVII